MANKFKLILALFCGIIIFSFASCSFLNSQVIENSQEYAQLQAASTSNSAQKDNCGRQLFGDCEEGYFVYQKGGKQWTCCEDWDNEQKVCDDNTI